VAELERIARQFKCMPKKFELTNRLIMEENVEVVQSILDTSIALIGEDKSIYDLAFSFLWVDRRNQAKRLLETPGLRYDQNKLNYIAEKLIESGKLDALDDLVSFSKGLFGCDRDFLYHKLVSANVDNVDKIGEIWLQVQEEGHAPSDSLLNSIARVLKLGGQEVAFEVPVEHTPVVEQKLTIKKMSTKENPDDDIYKALTANDLNAAEEIVTVKWPNVSLKCKRKVLDTLIENDRLEEACRVATRLANSFENPRKIQFRECYHTICSKLDGKKSTEFLEGLNPEFRVRLAKQKPETSTSESINLHKNDKLVN